MTLSRRERRAVVRHLGRREITRRANATVKRVHELSGQGLSPAAIASTTGLPEERVLALLEDRGEGRS